MGWWIAATERFPTRRGKSVTVRRGGVPFVKIRLATTDVEIYAQVLSRRDYDFAGLGNPKVIVDAGAHIGLASMWFASQFPEAKIVAVELDPSNFALLSENVSRYPQIHPVHAALWPRAETVIVANPNDDNWEFRAVASANGVTVDAVTVASLMERFGFDRIDLLKLDIEGAERSVLDASAPWIDRVDAIVAELHDRIEPGCSRAFFAATAGFASESWRGENVLVSRDAHVGIP